MDLSFDIKNSEGDHIMVALSYYDYESIRIFSSDPLTLTLAFYDVTLIRKSGEGYVGYKGMFDMYIKSHHISWFINHRVEIEDPHSQDNRQFAHFICRTEHEKAVATLGQILMEK